MEKIKFNSNWKLWKDSDPFELVFRVPEEAVDVELPHDAMFHEEQKQGAVNGGYTGNIDGGEYKYYKQFFVPEEYRGGHVMLQFEGIYRNASVFVNQSKVGESAYGYTDFTVEIGDYLKYGEQNTVLVAVKCGTRSSRWYSGAGIYRDVYLIHGKSIYVRPYGLRMTTLDADADGALVCVSARIYNDSLNADTVTAAVTIRDADGNTAVNNSYPVRINSRRELEFRKNVYLEHAKLWDELEPNLYTVTFTVSNDLGALDETEIVSGVRKLTVDSRHGLRVNGRNVKLRGACIHHDQGILGTATYDDYEYRRVKRLKEAGFNAIRSAHNPASQALLRACDRLGVYVMDELVDVWNKSKVSYDYSIDFQRNWESDMEHMVEADYNHPSVILYSTGNEIFEICTEKGFETSRMLSDKFHELDPSRYTTNGINGAFAAGDALAQIVDDITNGEADTGRGDVNVFMAAMENNMPGIVSHPILGGILEKLETTMDVIGYNYMTSRYLMDAEKYADRVMVGTETYPKQIAENWDTIMRCPAVIGDFTWTGWDYLGEVSSVYPDLMNTGGDISIIGNRRPVSYYREIVFGLTKKPCIAVQDPASYGSPRNFGPWRYTDCTFNYSYEGQEGKPVMIQVYGGGDSAELFINGRSLGVQPCGKETNFETQFHTVYEPGELLAVAYENGKEIGRTSLKSSQKAEVIKLDLEKYETLAFVNVDILDGDGVLAADSNAPLSIQIHGPAKLLAFAGVKALHRKGYELPETTAGEGHALAVLKLTGEAGKIKVTVSGKDLKEASVEF
ncbi:MAG: glycoside hydrolase family 2 TIM barrel-domain containing protein [Eubacteriales bacterium]|nr:glycoside hydrolase family 2 TIM barrel-domain containing protein [Eubacteriales bacterium]